MDEYNFMWRAIELAQKGRGWTNPNPMVGAVVVKNGSIIGEGYHQRYGEPHAERNALAACQVSPAGATLYVTLEPCCHYGRTPPCTEAIIEAKIARVVIGSRDPNPKVAGKGVAILRSAGIDVVEDYLRSECDAFNQVFFHYITTKHPYVVMKYAMTADGKIATYTGASQWITGTAARTHVHAMRSTYSGIMVGIGTVLADDPMLNCRLEKGHSPVRIVCDSKLRIPYDSQLVKSANQIPVIVATAKGDQEKEQILKKYGVTILHVPDGEGRVDLCDLMKLLGEMGIDSILLEGGGELNYSALQSGIVKKCCVFIGAKIFGGAKAKGPVGGSGVAKVMDSVLLTKPQIKTFGTDIMLEYEIGDEKICSPES